MNFEWDAEKARTNARKHHVSFDEAAEVFRDPFELTLPDSRHSASEQRWIAIGTSNARLLTVSYVERGDTLRIITARESSREEQRTYEQRR